MLTRSDATLKKFILENEKKTGSRSIPLRRTFNKLVIEGGSKRKGNTDSNKLQKVPKFSSFVAPSAPRMTPSVKEEGRNVGWTPKYPTPGALSFSACMRPEKTSMPMSTSLKQKCIESMRNHLRQHPEQADAFLESIKDLDPERAAQMYQVVSEFTGKRLSQVPKDATFSAPSAPTMTPVLGERHGTLGWIPKYPTPSFSSFVPPSAPKTTPHLTGGEKRSSDGTSDRSKKRPKTDKYNCFEERSEECDKKLRKAVAKYLINGGVQRDLYIEYTMHQDRSAFFEYKDQDGKISENDTLYFGIMIFRFRDNYYKHVPLPYFPLVIPVDGHLYTIYPVQYSSDDWKTQHKIYIRVATKEDLDTFNAKKRKRFEEVSKERLKPLRDAAAWVNHISDTYNEGTRDLICKNLTYTDRDSIERYHRLHHQIMIANEFATENGFEPIPLSEHKPVGDKRHCYDNLEELKAELLANIDATVKKHVQKRIEEDPKNASWLKDSQHTYLGEIGGNILRNEIFQLIKKSPFGHAMYTYYFDEHFFTNWEQLLLEEDVLTQMDVVKLITVEPGSEVTFGDFSTVYKRLV